MMGFYCTRECKYQINLSKIATNNWVTVGLLKDRKSASDESESKGVVYKKTFEK